METASLMGNSEEDAVSLKKRQWIVPRLLQRIRKISYTIRKDTSKWMASTRSNHGDQATVAPSHSTVSRLDESYDSCEVKAFIAAKKRQHMSTSHHQENYDFDEELPSFAQLNTSEPSAVYFAHADGMEVILKNGVISDATVYSWSPSPGEMAKVKEVPESMLPVEEISFFPEDSHYSTLIDQDQRDDSRFASFDLDFKSGADGVPSLTTVEDYLDAQFGPPFLSTVNTSSSTEHSKPTAAMIKRMSVFTGEDLLTQEADSFAKQFLEKDEKSKSSMAMKQPNSQLRSSESRLLAAFNADDDTISKDRSILLLNNLIEGHDDEDATISTVTGINIYPTRTETITESTAEVNTNPSFCGLFFSEPIMTDDDDGDDYSDVYSRPSTTESSSFYHTYR